MPERLLQSIIKKSLGKNKNLRDQYTPLIKLDAEKNFQYELAKFKLQLQDDSFVGKFLGQQKNFDRNQTFLASSSKLNYTISEIQFSKESEESLPQNIQQMFPIQNKNLQQKFFQNTNPNYQPREDNQMSQVKSMFSQLFDLPLQQNKDFWNIKININIQKDQQINNQEQEEENAQLLSIQNIKFPQFFVRSLLQRLESNSEIIFCLKNDKELSGKLQEVQEIMNGIQKTFIFKDSQQLSIETDKKFHKLQKFAVQISEINRIEQILFKIEKIIETIDREKDIEIKRKNPTNQNPEKISLKIFPRNLVINILNQVILSKLIQTIIASRDKLLDHFERFYAILPLRDISQKIFEVLPINFKQKRRVQRERLFLQNEKFEENEKSSGSPDIFNQKIFVQLENDQRILVALYNHLLGDIFNKNAFHNSFQNLNHLGHLAPQFKIKLILNPNFEKKVKKKIKIEEILKKRALNRKFIYNYKEFDFQTIIKEFLKLDQETEEDQHYNVFARKCQNKKISMYRFGWFNRTLLSFKYQPDLENLEQKIKENIKAHLIQLLDLDKLADASNKFDFGCLKDIFQGFNQKIDEQVYWSFQGPLALLLILSNFDFILQNKKVSFPDLSQNKERIEKVKDEYQALKRDLVFFKELFPYQFDFGFYSIQTEEIKKALIEAISNCKAELEKSFLQILQSTLERNESKVLEILNQLQRNAASIKEYIEILSFIRNPDLEQEFVGIEEDVRLCQDLMDYINENYIDYDPKMYIISFESRNWLLNLNSFRAQSLQKLNDSRPKFKAVLEELKRNVLKELQVLSNDIENFYMNDDLEQSDRLANESSKLSENMRNACEKAKELNYQEEFLEYPVTDFNQFLEINQEFVKLMVFWDVASKWTLESRLWVHSPFSKLEEDQLQEIQQQNILTLQSLEEDFKAYPQLIRILRRLLFDMRKFGDQLEIIMILKSHSWKNKHWKDLRKEMIPSQISEPLQTTEKSMEKYSWRDMMQENIMNF